MTRPFYETEADLENERLITMRLEREGLMFEKLRPKDVLDFAIIRDGHIYGFLEVKAWKCSSTKWPTFMLSMAKFLYMKQTFHAFGLPTALVVRYTDRILRLWVRDTTPHFVEIGGRRDRGDPDDLEPVVHLRLETFDELILGEDSVL